LFAYVSIGKDWKAEKKMSTNFEEIEGKAHFGLFIKLIVD
jgi:hypothetical protein